MNLVSGSPCSRSISIAFCLLTGLAGAARAATWEMEVSRLKSSELAERRAAAWELGKLGRKAVPAASELVKTLGDADDELRWASAWALRKVGPESAASLQPAIRDQSDKTRRAAAYVLQGQAKDSKEAMKLLVQAALDKDPLVRSYSQQAMEYLGPQHASLRVEVIEFAFGDRGTASQSKDLWARLDRLGPPQKSDAPGLSRLIQNPQDEIWLAAIRETMRLGPDAEGLVPELQQQLRSSDSRRANLAIVALGAIGKAANSASPDVVELLRKQFAALGPPEPDDAAGPFNNDRLRQIKSRRQGLISAAQVEALANIRASEETAGPLLMALIRSYVGRGNPKVNRDAYIPSNRVLAPIRDLIPGDFGTADAQPAVRAMSTLAAICPQAPDEVLTLLNATERDVRLAGVRTIGCFGPKGASTVPQLRRLLQDQDEHHEVRQEVWATLSLIGPDAKDAIPEIVAAITATTETANYWLAIDALVAMGPAATDELLKLLEHKQKYVRLFTLRSMARNTRAIETEAKRLIPAINQLLLTESNIDVANEAVGLLSNFGPAAHDVISTLASKMPMKEPEKLINQRWFRAMHLIGPDHTETIAMREYSRRKTVASPNLDPALPVVLDGDHFQEEDVRQYLSFGGGDEAVWKRVAPRSVPLLLAGLNGELGPSRRLRALKSLAYVDADKHSEIVAPILKLLDGSDLELSRQSLQLLGNMNLERHPEVVVTLITKWIAATPDNTKAEYGALIRKQASVTAPAMDTMLEKMDENTIKAVLNDIGSFGREGEVFSSLVKRVALSGRPGITAVATKNWRKICPPMSESLPELVEEVRHVPDPDNIVALVEFGPIAAPALADLLANSPDRKLYILLLKAMATARATMPYAWLEIDSTLERWQTNPPTNAPKFLVNQAGTARAPAK